LVGALSVGRWSLECGDFRRFGFLFRPAPEPPREESKAAMLAHAHQLKEGEASMYTTLFTEMAVYKIVY
jgi:hypothetical protein